MCLTSGFKEKAMRFIAVVLRLASHLPAIWLTASFCGMVLGVGVWTIAMWHGGRGVQALSLELGETSYNP